MEIDTSAISTLKTVAEAVEVPPFALCPSCKEVYNIPYCLSCSHSVCKTCYDREVARNRYMRCPVCSVLTVSRPYVNGAFQNLIANYTRYNNVQATLTDYSSALKCRFFHGRTLVKLTGTTPTVGRRLFHTGINTVLDVAVAQEHKTQPTFLGITFVHRTAEQGNDVPSVTLRFCIKVIHKDVARSRAYEAVHVFPQGGGSYSVPVGPKHILFDPAKGYILDGNVGLELEATSLPGVTMKQALSLANKCRAFQSCEAPMAEKAMCSLISDATNYGGASAAMILRFLLVLGRLEVTVASAPTKAIPDGSVVSLVSWLRNSALVSKMLAKSVNYFATSDTALISSVLGRHCAALIESDQAFDITLPRGNENQQKQLAENQDKEFKELERKLMERRAAVSAREKGGSDDAENVQKLTALHKEQLRLLDRKTTDLENKVCELREANTMVASKLQMTQAELAEMQEAEKLHVSEITALHKVNEEISGKLSEGMKTELALRDKLSVLSSAYSTMLSNMARAQRVFKSIGADVNLSWSSNARMNADGSMEDYKICVSIPAGIKLNHKSLHCAKELDLLSRGTVLVRPDAWQATAPSSGKPVFKKLLASCSNGVVFDKAALRRSRLAREILLELLRLKPLVYEESKEYNDISRR